MGKSCKKCKGPVSTGSRSGACGKCRDRRGALNSNYKGVQDRACIDCSAKVSETSKARCRKCHHKFVKGDKHPRWKGGLKAYYKRAYLHQKSRLKKDLLFRLTKQIRTRLATAVRRQLITKKGGSSIAALGCSIMELRAHLERQFKPGMTWKNWGIYGWHIDHIVPLSSFDLSKPEDVAKACHFSNLQPLLAEENLKKKDRIYEGCDRSR